MMEYCAAVKNNEDQKKNAVITELSMLFGMRITLEDNELLKYQVKETLIIS